MAIFDITTRKHGNVRFVARDGGGYVRIYGADLGTLDGKQICDGGGFGGQTLIAGANDLEKVARKWWGQFLRAERAMA